MLRFESIAGVRYALLLLAIAAFACSFTPAAWATNWTGDVDESWNEAGNWSGSIPGSGTNATLINRTSELAELEIVRLNGQSGVARWLTTRSETSFRITNGGTLDAVFVTLQHDDFFIRDTSLVISGAGSRLTTGAMFVCELEDVSNPRNSGFATVTVEDGGALVVDDTGILIGRDQNCEAEVTVRGEGSMLDFTGASSADFGFESGADTELNVSGGAVVHADFLSIGDNGNTSNVIIGGSTGSGYREPGLLSVPLDGEVDGASSANLIFEHAHPDHAFVNDDGDPVTMSGSHEVYQRGPGTTRFLTDGGDFGGNLIVESGTLILDAGYPDSDAIAAFGSTLEAHESVESVTLNGTLVPLGDSMGELDVNENYSQVASATIETVITPDGNSDFIDVAGSASIEGGTLSVEMAPGNYTVGDEYVILEADDGVIGFGFSGIDQSPDDPQLEIVQTPDQIRIRVVGSPQLSISPEETDFGAVSVGSSESRDVTLSNTGQMNLVINAVEAAVAPFERSGGTCAASGATVLAPGWTCTLEYTFSPGSLADEFLELEVLSNDSAGPIAFSLSGEGVTSAALKVDSTLLNFGDWSQGQSSTIRTVTITSTGDDPLEIDSLSFGGDHPSDFQVVEETCISGTISPDETCEVDLVFTPGGPGKRLATLLIESNSPESPADVDLSGNLDVIFSDRFDAGTP